MMKAPFAKTLICITFSLLACIACGNELDRNRAEELVKAYYQFPIVHASDFKLKVFWSKRSTEEAKRQGLVTSNLIYMKNYDEYMDGNDHYDLTENGKLYCVSSNDSWSNPTKRVVTNCVNDLEITGLKMDENSNTATVEYTLRRVGVTPFGEYMGYKNGDILKCASTLEKYDDGWRVNDKHEKNLKAQDYVFFTKEGNYKP